MATEQNIGHKIEQFYKQNFIHPFPLNDVRKLKAVDPSHWDSFHGSLDMYFSYIAGYASSASRLDRRPHSELIEAKQNLSSSFFDQYPKFSVYLNQIREVLTPNLCQRLDTVEHLRIDLLTLIQQILEG